MDDILGSFSRCARMKPKCAEKTCVGLWGQSTVSLGSHQHSDGPRCYHWYQSNLATMTNRVFNAPSEGKDPETKVQRGRCILKRR